jgi:hypothetical protein
MASDCITVKILFSDGLLIQVHAADRKIEQPSLAPDGNRRGASRYCS